MLNLCLLLSDLREFLLDLDLSFQIGDLLLIHPVRLYRYSIISPHLKNLLLIKIIFLSKYISNLLEAIPRRWGDIIVDYTYARQIVAYSRGFYCWHLRNSHRSWRRLCPCSHAIVALSSRDARGHHQHFLGSCLF
jgi:hypothetical protein